MPIDDAERIAALGVTASRVPVLWERVAPLDPHARDFREPQRAARRAARARHRADRHAAASRQRAAVSPICSIRRFRSGSPNMRARRREQFPWVRRWTPINEPLTTARFATLYGVWYPNMRDDRAFGRAMVNQTLAHASRDAPHPARDSRCGVRADRRSAALHRRRSPASAEYVAFLRERAFLSAELVAGRVDDDHPLAAFLLDRCGVNPFELGDDACATRACPISWRSTTIRIRNATVLAAPTARRDVPAVYVAGEPSPAIGPLLRAAAERLRLPLAVGEVHVHAPAPERVRWLAQHVADVEALRADGVDVRALGAWAAFGMVDWHSLLRRQRRASRKTASTRLPARTERRSRRRSPMRCASLPPAARIADDGVRGWWERDERVAHARGTRSRCAMRACPRAITLRGRRQRDRVTPPEVFVAGLHLRWDGVWQRPHHLLTRLAHARAGDRGGRAARRRRGSRRRHASRRSYRRPSAAQARLGHAARRRAGACNRARSRERAFVPARGSIRR